MPFFGNHIDGGVTCETWHIFCLLELFWFFSLPCTSVILLLCYAIFLEILRLGHLTHILFFLIVLIKMLFSLPFTSVILLNTSLHKNQNKSNLCYRRAFSWQGEARLGRGRRRRGTTTSISTPQDTKTTTCGKGRVRADQMLGEISESSLQTLGWPTSAPQRKNWTIALEVGSLCVSSPHWVEGARRCYYCLIHSNK